MTKVTVTHPFLGEQELDKDHADRLMKMKRNGGWKIKKTSNAKLSGSKKDTGKTSK